MCDFVAGAINHLVKYLACDWAGDNIRVNTIAPGVIKTPLSEQVRNSYSWLSRSIDRSIGLIEPGISRGIDSEKGLNLVESQNNTNRLNQVKKID